jgi:hypothetical protein
MRYSIVCDVFQWLCFPSQTRIQFKDRDRWRNKERKHTLTNVILFVGFTDARMPRGLPDPPISTHKHKTKTPAYTLKNTTHIYTHLYARKHNTQTNTQLIGFTDARMPRGLRDPPDPHLPGRLGGPLCESHDCGRIRHGNMKMNSCNTFAMPL